MEKGVKWAYDKVEGLASKIDSLLKFLNTRDIKWNKIGEVAVYTKDSKNSDDIKMISYVSADIVHPVEHTRLSPVSLPRSRSPNPKQRARSPAKTDELFPPLSKAAHFAPSHSGYANAVLRGINKLPEGVIKEAVPHPVEEVLNTSEFEGLTDDQLEEALAEKQVLLEIETKKTEDYRRQEENNAARKLKFQQLARLAQAIKAQKQARGEQ